MCAEIDLVFPRLPGVYPAIVGTLSGAFGNTPINSQHTLQHPDFCGTNPHKTSTYPIVCKRAAILQARPSSF